MPKRKGKTGIERVRDLYARSPNLSVSEIARRLGLSRQLASAALGRKRERPQHLPKSARGLVVRWRRTGATASEIARALHARWSRVSTTEVGRAVGITHQAVSEAYKHPAEALTRRGTRG